MLELVELQHKRKCFIYKRLSTHEQLKKSVFSIAMQDALEDLAIGDGYRADLSKEQIHALKSDHEYQGYYANGDIIVEERDLGISGTLGADNRPGLAYLIRLIESDSIESVYVIHTSRLFRDQTLIDGLTFGELCKKHNIVIIMPNMRLNLRDKMHMRIFRMELERAADELEVLRLRMGGAREMKAKQGYFAAGSVPVGYIVNKEKGTENYDKFVIYSPHASIVKKIFELLPAVNFSPLRLARRLNNEGICVPFFEPPFTNMVKRSAVAHMKVIEGKGYLITRKFVTSVATNPTFIGWWVWGGTLISKNNHPAIIDEDCFWHVQERLSRNKPKGRAVYAEPTILQGLLYCANHKIPVAISGDRSEGRYRCYGEYVVDSDHTYCFASTAQVLEEPITQCVISQLSFSDYAEKVVAQLKEGYDEAKEQADTNKRELARVSAEIGNLKENLARTKRPEQVEMILQMIEERVREKARLSEIKSYPAGRLAQQFDLNKISKFLGNINERWGGLSSELKNEFLRTILDRVLLTPDKEHGTIAATIIFRTGFEERLLIQRPKAPSKLDNKWSDSELATMRRCYSTAKWEDLFQMLPNRECGAIRSKAAELSLRRAKGTKPHGKPWTKEEDDALRKVRAGLNESMDRTDLVELAQRLKRTPAAIWYRYLDLGYRVSRYTGWREALKDGERKDKGKARVSWRMLPVNGGEGNELPRL